MAAMEIKMRLIWRWSRVLVAMVISFAIGSVPACGTMGGGGMKYLWEPPSVAQNHVST